MLSNTFVEQVKSKVIAKEPIKKEIKPADPKAEPAKKTVEPKTVELKEEDEKLTSKQETTEVATEIQEDFIPIEEIARKPASKMETIVSTTEATPAASR